MQTYNIVMKEKEYVPNEADLDWLAGQYGKIPDSRNEQQLKWRDEHTTQRDRIIQSHSVAEKQTIKNVIIAIIVIAAIIYFYHKGSTGVNATDPACIFPGSIGDQCT